MRMNKTVFLRRRRKKAHLRLPSLIIDRDFNILQIKNYNSSIKIEDTFEHLSLLSFMKFKKKR